MSNRHDGWQLLDRIGEVLAVGGFVVDLVIRILQINGLIPSIPTRQSLLVGAITSAIAAVVFIIIGISKFYTDKAFHYHKPIWDFLIGAALAALAITCFITLAGPTHPASRAKTTTSADRPVVPSVQHKRAVVVMSLD